MDELQDRRIEAFGMLLEAHNELVNAVHRRTEADDGLPIPWLGVLIRLARSPGGQLRMTELARDMTMSTSGLTRLVDRIEASGHVARQACPEDRRGMLAVLTDEGRAVLERITPCHLDDLQRHLGEAFDDAELEQLTALLRRLRDHIRAQPAG